MNGSSWSHEGYGNSDELRHIGHFIFQVIAEYLQKIDPKSDGAKRDWVAIYDECANVLYEVLRSPLIALIFYSFHITI